MRTLYVTSWLKQEDGSHILNCRDEHFGTTFTVEIPFRHSSFIDYEDLNKGWLNLPEDYSIKVAC